MRQGSETASVYAPGEGSRQGLRAAYASASILLAMVLLGNILFAQEPGAMSGGLGSLVSQIGYMSSFGFALIANNAWRDFRRVSVLPLSLVIALAWCWLSLLWAISPPIAFRRIVQTTVVTLTVFLIVRQLGYARTLGILRWSFVATLACCYLAVFANPKLGIQDQSVISEAGTAGSWRGILADKNIAGAFCAILILLFMFDGRDMKRALRAIVLCSAGVFLFFSQSKTSIGVLVAVIALAAALTFYKPRFRWVLVPLVAFGIMAVVFQWSELLAPFRDALYDPNAFTGRGAIWITLVRYLEDNNWLLGSGFGSFWAVGADTPAYRYTDVVWIQELVQVGHNGYLDLFAQIGLPGLVIVLMATIVLPMARVLGSLRLRSGQITLIAAIILFCIGNNLTESTLFSGDTLLNVAMMFAIAMIGSSDPERARKAKLEPSSLSVSKAYVR